MVHRDGLGMEARLQLEVPGFETARLRVSALEPSPHFGDGDWAEGEADQAVCRPGSRLEQY
jgi:hypothetical protein